MSLEQEWLHEPTCNASHTNRAECIYGICIYHINRTEVLAIHLSNIKYRLHPSISHAQEVFIKTIYICFTGILHPSDQEKILRKHHVELLRQLNFDLLLPYLNQHGLLTGDDHEDLVNPLHTSATRINKLLILLPRKGSRFLYRFVECLQQSAEECPPHKELRDLLQGMIRSTVHRQASRGQYNYTLMCYFSALRVCYMYMYTGLSLIHRLFHGRRK